MSDCIYSAGNTNRSTATVLAEKAGRYIASFTKGTERAVCIDPRGRVTVEPVTSACEGDLIGVYVCARFGAWMQTATLIEADIKAVTGEMRRAA